MGKKHIIALIIIGLFLITGILFFVFLKKDKNRPDTINTVVQTGLEQKSPVANPNKSKGVTLNDEVELKPNEIPDESEVKENSEYVNFENTIDRLIEVTER